MIIFMSPKYCSRIRTKPPKLSERVLEKVLIGFGVVVGVAVVVPLVCIGCVVAAPFVGCMYGVDEVNDVCVDKQHQKRMRDDWEYRFKNTAVRMKTLKVWQEHLLRSDPCVRKVMMIAEAGDVPFEVWPELRDESTAREFFQEQAQLMGTPEYARNAVASAAVSHFVRKYAANTGVSEDAAWDEVQGLIESNGLWVCRASDA